MPTSGFGGPYSGGSYSAGVVYSDGIGLPTGRAMKNGAVSCLIVSLFAYIGGESRVITGVTLTLGSATTTSSFTVPKQASDIGAGYYGTNHWLVSGGSARFQVNNAPSGALYIGRNSGDGNTVYGPGGWSRSGTFGGAYEYWQAPTAPQSLTATPHASSSGTISLAWAAPSDNGGSAVADYAVVRDGTILAYTAGLTYSDTGRTPGTSYTYEVRARNAVTSAAGTQSVDSNSVSAVAPGVPTAPQTLVGTPSASITGRVGLSWAAPATPGSGGIVGYNVYRDGAQIGTVTGTGTTYTVTGLTPYTSYAFYVKARNAFAQANGTQSAASGTVNTIAPGPPSAPLSLTGSADGLVAGKIDLSWSAPTNTGAGGITGYNVRYSGGVLAATTTGTGTTVSITGLNPGQSYTFYVTGRNALADSESSESAASNSVTVQALGAPDAPTALAVVADPGVAGRLNLSWTPPAGTLTGYSVFDTTALPRTLIAVVRTAYYSVDGVPSGSSRTYEVQARNSYTDTLGAPGNLGGPASTSASGTASSNTTQTVASIVAATDSTNQSFNGTFTINAVTPTTLRYAKTAPNVTAVATPSGTIINNTNSVFNGVQTITAATASTVSYAKTNANISATNISGGALTDTTNQSFNGTFTVTAVNSGAKTIDYARIASAVTTRAVPVNVSPGAFGTVSNTSNAIFNGTGLTIIGVTYDTFSYTKTHADVAEINAAGTATDITNRDEYNGSFVVDSIEEYDSFTYTASGGDHTVAVILSPPGGTVHREVSPANLEIKYRSGWAG